MTNPLTQLRRAAGGGLDGVRNRWETAPGAVRWAVYLLLILGALVLPSDAIGSVMSPRTDWATLLFNPIGIYVLLAIGLNVVVGQAGLLDLGYVAFFAIGGYAMAMLGTKLHWDFWVILVAGVLISALSGVVLGAPTLRLRGDYLAIVTLGFGEIVRIVANNTDSIGGPNGISGIPHPPTIADVAIGDVHPLRYGILDPRPYYYLLVAICVLVIIFVRRLEHSRVGRSWAAIREDEEAAEIMGVPTYRFKLLAFAIGASIGGAAGVVFASKVISITPMDFPFILSATILAAVVLGGSGNLPGVILGAFVMAWLPEFLRGVSPSGQDFSQYRTIAFAGLLVAMMIWRPEGLLPSRRRKAEFAEGTGGLGGLGAEVTGPDTSSAEVTR
ncbi:MAG TPA: branched-chain amino acid ABC transporter permease [Mycobacteriales bacterium]|nr:branched-chain amino acid ABC transporter permease [Mycobacteriales bacterium]